MTKMTYVNALTFCIEMINDIIDGVNGFDYDDERMPEVMEKLTALRASLEKKNGAKRKPTKKQEANAVLKSAIADYLRETGGGKTVSDLIKEVECLGDLSNQKVTALVRQLILDGVVVTTVDKRKSYFSVVEGE